MLPPTVIITYILLIVSLFLVPEYDAARISVSRGKNASKMDDLCARMHNNTALEGTSPLEMMQATAFECQKKCVDMFPDCTAVVYYYLHNEAKHHFCYLFEQNSVEEKVDLVEQKPEHKKDLVRMLEIVPDCHLFDAHPPLEEDGLASSTDKVDRKKRQQGNEAVNGIGSWTDWSDCSNNGHEIRTQVCEYGRKIQRRGCPARQPQQQRNYAPPPQRQPQPYPHQQQQPYPQPQDPRQLSLSPRPPSRPIPPQPPLGNSPQRSPYDEYAQRYQERMSQYRTNVNQRHPAVAQAAPCPGGNCEPYPPAPTRPQPQPQPRPPSGYKPAPPTPPQCGSKDCAPVLTQGVWHEWSEWSSCSCTCDEGMRARRRECSTNNCQGPEMETEPCNLGPCQTWSDWCEWSTCSASCGSGERSRTRFCYQGTNRCEGKDFEADRCDAGPCPEWTEWCEWSTCSASCGRGIATRSRSCLGGADHLCPGQSTEQKSCEERPCSEWAPWQEWGACSVSCGNGMKRRQRVCQYGTDCPGPAEESLFCYGPTCAEWSQWCEWTSCSSKCGPGQRTRTRSCSTSDGRESNDCQGPSIENLPCEGTNCCQWGEWCGWSKCDSEYGGGKSIRTRACTNRQGLADPNCHCEGPDREEKACAMPTRAPTCDWTQWCEWSACSSATECVVGVNSRSRQCVGEPGCNCLGMAEESQQCRGTQPCKKEPPC